jgi:hypothetical protein
VSKIDVILKAASLEDAAFLFVVRKFPTGKSEFSVLI